MAVDPSLSFFSGFANERERQGEARSGNGIIRSSTCCSFTNQTFRQPVLFLALVLLECCLSEMNGPVIAAFDSGNPVP
jgi:hypothetical protein